MGSSQSSNADMHQDKQRTAKSLKSLPKGIRGRKSSTRKGEAPHGLVSSIVSEGTSAFNLEEDESLSHEGVEVVNVIETIEEEDASVSDEDSEDESEDDDEGKCQLERPGRYFLPFSLLSTVAFASASPRGVCWVTHPFLSSFLS